jgi:hypothetical protein
MTMIDFNNGKLIKLSMVSNDTFASRLNPFLITDEKIVSSYQSIRDGVVFTNKRIIAINVQGITGKKQDYTSMPYNKIQVFSVETAGVIDLDSELDLWFSNVGRIRFEFSHNSNITEICKVISEHVLN